MGTTPPYVGLRRRARSASESAPGRRDAAAERPAALWVHRADSTPGSLAYRLRVRSRPGTGTGRLIRLMVMRCEHCREALSALLDDEDPGVDLHLVDRHLAGCAPPAAPTSAGWPTCTGRSRVRQAEAVPDLSGAILARIAPRVNPHDPVLGWLRSGLTFVGVLVVNPGGGPARVEQRGQSRASGRLGPGFRRRAAAFAAWQPERAARLVAHGRARSWCR